MNAFDICIVIILCLTLAMGVWKGLLKQILSLAGVVTGAFLGFQYHETLAANFSQLDPNVGRIVVFCILFFGSMIAAMLLNWLLKNLMDAVGLKSFDKIGGAMLGFLKGWLIAAVFCFILTAILPANHSLLRNSFCLPYMLQSMAIVKEAMPNDLLAKYELKLKMLQAGRFSDETYGKGKALIMNLQGFEK